MNCKFLTIACFTEFSYRHSVTCCLFSLLLACFLIACTTVSSVIGGLKSLQSNETLLGIKSSFESMTQSVRETLVETLVADEEFDENLQYSDEDEDDVNSRSSRHSSLDVQVGSSRHNSLGVSVVGMSRQDSLDVQVGLDSPGHEEPDGISCVHDRTLQLEDSLDEMNIDEGFTDFCVVF